MTSIILSTICALALNAAPAPAQTDTSDLYLIDNVKVENFNGSQLAGKTVNTYVIRRENIGGIPTRIHFITTNAGDSQMPAVVLMDSDFSNATVVSVKSIEVMKGSSAAKYLQDLKDQGRYQGDINSAGGVIVVNLKK